MTLDKSIVTSVIKTAVEEMKRHCHFTEDTNLKATSELAFKEVLWRSWNKALTAVNAFSLHGSAPSAEQAVAACIHAGLDKSNVSCSQGAFLLKYPNFIYRIRKEISGFIATPKGILRFNEPSGPVFGIPPEEFHAFLTAFDALFPDLKEAAGVVMTELSEYITEIKRQKMVEKVHGKVIGALVEEHLSPLGIKAQWWIRGEDVFVVFTKDDLSGSMEVTFEELEKTLLDTQAIQSILTSLRKHPRRGPSIPFGYILNK